MGMKGKKWRGRIRASLLFLLPTHLLLSSSTTICAFGPPRHNHRSVSRRRPASLQKNNLNAFSNTSSSTSPSSIPSPSPSSSGPPFRLERIDHIVIRCQNFPLMFDFYHRIIGCTIDEPKEEHENRFGGALTHLRAGSSYIDLLAYDTNHLTEAGKEATARMHAGGVGLDGKRLGDVNFSSETSTLDHLCLRIDPFDRKLLLNYLEEENVEIIVVGEKRLGADGVGPSVYVRDPEGNVIELKGSPYHDNDQNKVEDSAENKQSDNRSHVPYVAVQEREETDYDGNSLPPSNDAKEESPQAKSTNKKNESTSIDVPLTPCNRICRYNSSFYDGQVCIGCYREAYEIEMWQSMTPMQKSMTLLDAIDRCSDNQQGDGETRDNFDGAVTIEELTRQFEHWSELVKRLE
ncbi:hypothetical protein ACHAXR_009584 [Thalassiosira sp. AJA248-18]